MLHEYSPQPNRKIIPCIRLHLVHCLILEFQQPVGLNGLAELRFGPLKSCEPHYLESRKN